MVPIQFYTDDGSPPCVHHFVTEQDPSYLSPTRKDYFILFYFITFPHTMSYKQNKNDNK